MASIDDNSLEIQSLIQGLQRTDPRLYDALLSITTQLGQITRVLVPIQKIVGVRAQGLGNLVPPTVLTYEILNSAIRIEWERPANGGLFSFEVRQGEVWDIARFITRTNGTIVDLRPVPGIVANFLIKSINSAGEYSDNYTSILVILPLPSQVSLNGTVIDNNVLLKWTNPISLFDIDFFEIRKNGVLIGTTKANFTVIFETVAGAFVYDITPVDIVGNSGLASSVSLSVNQPPDYVLTASTKSDFHGTQTNILVEFDPSLVGV